MVLEVRSGRIERMPYSLSRWTDISAKWEWFKVQLAQGWMIGFDPRNAIPSRWSLKPEDTFGLVFWTKDPRRLYRGLELLQGHDRIQAHVTITGWHEVEHGVMTKLDACEYTSALADRIGSRDVAWRFSPVPLLNRVEVIERFESIAWRLKRATTRCYVSFLQPNDLMPEARSTEEKTRLLLEMARVASDCEIEVILCQDDHTLDGYPPIPNLRAGVCVPPESFGHDKLEVEDCGCVPMIDPFTLNEACSKGCEYCYASDRELNPRKRDTTSLIRLPVLP
jgi:hypothetical protein